MKSRTLMDALSICLRPFRTCLATAALGATSLVPLHADLIFWTGGDGVWDNSDANWSPSDEPDPDDDVIIGNGSSVMLGSHNAVESLAILSGASLRTEQYALGVADQVTVSGTLQIGSNSMTATPPLVSLTTSNVQVGNGGQLRMANAIEIDDASGVGVFEISNGGTLFGNDNLHFADQFSGTQTVLVNHGVIGVGNVTNSIIPLPGAPPARTLHITTADLGARFDLDGNGTGIVNVGRNGTLNIDGTVTEFKGQINLGHNSTLDISNGWKLGESGGGTLTVDNGFVSGGILGQDIPADVATMKGGQVTMNHPDSVINMVDDDGGLVFDAPFHASRGTIQHHGSLTFNAPTFIGFAVDFQNAFNSDLIVNSLVEVHDADWDWDSTGSARTVTINEGGELRTRFLNSMADDLWSANMILNGGKLFVETLDDMWGQNAGTIVVNASNGGSTIDGGILFSQTNGSLHVEHAASLNFDTPSRWSNGTLRVDGFGFSTNRWNGPVARLPEMAFSSRPTIQR